jgi:hypothetical protein
MNKRQINKEIERQKIEQFIKDNCWMLDYAWAPDHWYEVSEDAVVEFHKLAKELGYSRESYADEALTTE